MAYVLSEEELRSILVASLEYTSRVLRLFADIISLLQQEGVSDQTKVENSLELFEEFLPEPPKELEAFGNDPK